MKHAILGAGAIGGLVRTALASLWEDVTLGSSTGEPDGLSQELDAGTSAGLDLGVGESRSRADGTG
jgi:predicted dinucleotide-binding enzyme